MSAHSLKNEHPRPRAVLTHIPSFVGLSLCDPVGAPKKPAGHGGVRIDSGMHTVAQIVLSRVIKSTNETTLNAVASIPTGAAFMRSMRELFLHLARPQASMLEEANVTTLFQITGSTLMRDSSYNGLLSLPCRLPREAAYKVYSAYLDAIVTVRAEESGGSIAQVLSGEGGSSGAPSNSQAVVDAFVARVGELAWKKLGGPEAVAELPPQPPTALAPTFTLFQMLELFASAHVGQTLSQENRESLRSALDVAMSVLSSADAAERTRLLDSNVLEALVNANAAQIYSSLLAAAASGSSGECLHLLLERLESNVSSIAEASLSLAGFFNADAGVHIHLPPAINDVESESSDIDELTEVGESNVEGKGLFAAQDIPTGVVVAHMLIPARMKRSAWNEYHPAAGLPHDAAIYVARSPLVFFDAAWIEPERPPKWYRINHSSNPNLALGLLDPSKPPQEQSIVWRTTRRVDRREELFFTYEDVPAEWDDM